FVEIGNLDIAVMKTRHRPFRAQRKDQMRTKISAKSSRFIDAFSSREPVRTSLEDALAGDGGNRLRRFLRCGQSARLSRLFAAKPGIGQPLGGGLDRGQEAEQRQRQAKQPEREIEGAGR